MEAYSEYPSRSMSAGGVLPIAAWAYVAYSIAASFSERCGEAGRDPNYRPECNCRPATSIKNPGNVQHEGFTDPCPANYLLLLLKSLR